MDHARWGEPEQANPEDLRAREAAGTRSLLRGLLWMGVIALVFSVARAGMERAFIPGWWRQW